MATPEGRLDARSAAEQRVRVKSLACIDLRDGAFDLLHGSGDIQVGGVNADVPVVSIGCLPDCPIFRNLVDHVAPLLRGLLRPGSPGIHGPSTYRTRNA